MSLKSMRCEFISEATKFAVLQSIFSDSTHMSNTTRKGNDGTMVTYHAETSYLL